MGTLLYYITRDEIGHAKKVMLNIQDCFFSLLILSREHNTFSLFLVKVKVNIFSL